MLGIRTPWKQEGSMYLWKKVGGEMVTFVLIFGQMGL